MDSRVIVIEQQLASLTVELNKFGDEMKGMLKTVEDNDLAMKTSINAAVSGLDDKVVAAQATHTASTVQMDQQIVGLKSTVSQSEAKLDNKIVIVEQEIMDVEQNRITPMENKLEKLQVDLTNLMINTQNKIMEIESNQGQWEGGRERYQKPVTEFRVISDLKNLTNEKTGFKDWKVKMYNAMETVLETSNFRPIMTWIQDPSRKWTGTETDEETYEEAVTFAREAGDSNPCTQKEWRVWGNSLKTLLTQKAEEKSEAFLLVKRAGCGWSAWHSVYKWYSAVSGEGITDRMTKLMSPSPSKKDGEVMYDVEKWMDELRDCRALGASPMGFDYMLSAIRKIATVNIKEKMDIVDAAMDPLDYESRWNRGYETLMKWARIKLLDEREKGPKSMDMGNVAPTPENGDGKGQEQYGYMDQYMGWVGYGGKGSFGKGGKYGGKNMKGEYGKGGFGKGNYGQYGKGGWKGDSKGGKSGGKGDRPMTGPTGRTIFYGNCYNCKGKGHSKGSCPELGKGFKGNCDSCGVRGHTKMNCPVYPRGKGKGGMNVVEEEEGMNLGGGEDKAEPEAEKQVTVDNRAESNYNKFAPLGEDWTKSNGMDYQSSWNWN